MMKTVLVTGGNRGIGLAAVRQLAEQECFVILGSRDFQAGMDAAEKLRKEGMKVEAVQLDLSDRASIEKACKSIDEQGWHVDALINNAGVFTKKPLLELSAEEVEESLLVHLTGPLYLIQLLAPKMIEAGYGRIVNLSSGYGSFAEGMGGPGAYGFTKTALNALTVRLAKELPETVKVNSMCPGWVKTRMGGEGAQLSPDEGADTAVWLATLPDDGPTGGFFRSRKAIEW